MVSTTPPIRSTPQLAPRCAVTASSTQEQVRKDRRPAQDPGLRVQGPEQAGRAGCAVQNRLESTIANLNNVVNNLSGARSRIRTRTTPRKCRTCPRTRSCNRLVPRFWRKPTKCRKPFCRCCVNHASAGTAGQVGPRGPACRLLAFGSHQHKAGASRLLSTPRASTTVPDLSQSPDRIPRGTGRENSPELAWPPSVSRPLSGHMLPPCAPQPAFCPLIRF